ncbi:site-specific integrase [Oscillibacter sp.]|uniref:site-specific integrase n=1 Tax=Oscillibacter sp. TaxID=1945593 RepID=UPI0028985210|nr:site-specific integrase [Oscillibacter sp.]
MKKKLPTAQLLPSGNYRVRIMIDGQRVSVVDEDEKTAQAKAMALLAGIDKQKEKPLALTVGEAIDRYIESKSSVLSPSTISGYKRARNNSLQDLMNVRLQDLTREKVQRSVNAMSRTKASKTVKNAHGLLTAALSEFYPDLILHTTLPQKQRTDIIVPSESDIKAIAECVKGKSCELPVMLAVWLGLRMSEIRGLTWDCIDGNVIHIKQAKVDEGLKGTKTYNSNRRLIVPPYIMELIEKHPRTSEFIIPYSRRAIASRFDYYTAKAGIQHYRFHDLRHVNASVMLALNIPDKYAMERMGHATNNMLKTVYQHTMPEEQKKVSAAVDNYFSKILDTQMDTKK